MGFFTTWLINFLLSTVVSWLLAPDVEEPEDGTLLNKQSNLSDIPIIYGFKKVGGTRVFVETSGNDNKYLYIALVLCEGEIESIGDVYIKDILSTDDRYDGLVTINKHLGSDDQLADTTLMNAPSWTSEHRLRGVAYLGIRIKWDREVFGSIPNIHTVVEGRKVYDPRNDTTGYSSNPALCLLDYMRNERYGKGLLNDAFEPNLDSWKESADNCDALIIGYTGSEPSKIFSCNARIDTGQTVMSNVKVLLSGMRGLMPYTQGNYKLIVERQGDSVFDFTEDHIIDGISIQGEKKKERFNRVIAIFTNPDKNWQDDQVEYPRSDSTEYTDLLTEDDNIQLERRMKLPTITNPYIARHIAQTVLRKSRDGIKCSFLSTLEALQVSIGEIVSVTHSTPDWTNKPFRVIDLSLRPDGTVIVSLSEHQDAFYTWYLSPEIIIVPDTNLPDPFRVVAPTELEVQSGENQQITNDNGSTIPRILISWTKSIDEFTEKYIVQISTNNDNIWDIEHSTDVSPLYISGISSGTIISIRVKSVNALGVSSSWITAVHQIADLEGGGGVTTFSQSSPPLNITVGDYWFNTDNDKLYQYDGNGWIEQTVAFSQSIEPINITIQVDDLWLNTDNSAVYQYDGNNWILLNSFFQNTEPTNITIQVDDLWLNPDNSTVYQYDGVNWVLLNSFFQNTEPTNVILNIDDLWLNTDNNEISQYDGVNWVLLNTFYQDIEPTGIVIQDNDLWSDTLNNKLHQYDGTNTIDEVIIDADAGDWAYHALLGWARNQSSIDIVQYLGLDAFTIPDDDGNLYTLSKPLVFQDIQNLHLYGGVFGGRIAFDATNGVTSGFLMLETEQGTQIVDADNVTHPFATDDLRFSTKFGKSTTYVSLLAYETATQIIFNGTDTVNVIDSYGDAQINTVPEVLMGDYFDYEIHVQNGLNNTIFLYVNGILVANPDFHTFTGAGNANQMQFTSGSSSATDRTTYIRTFGVTINDTTGTGWAELPSGSITFTQNFEPTNVTLNVDDIWFDTDNNIVYQYDGVNWVLETLTFTQNFEPTNVTLNVDDIWFDTDNNIVYQYDGVNWVLQTITFIQSIEPTNLIIQVDDYWHDTDNNKVYQYDGVNWIEQTVSFYENIEPINDSAQDGDLWFDTDDGNKTYRFDGSNWVNQHGELALLDVIGNTEIDDDAIETRNVVDRNITLDKFSYGTPNTVLGYDGTGKPLEVCMQALEQALFGGGGLTGCNQEIFTSSGTWNWTGAGQPAFVNVFMIAAGGGGGGGGGGDGYGGNGGNGTAGTAGTDTSFGFVTLSGAGGAGGAGGNGSCQSGIDGRILNVGDDGEGGNIGGGNSGTVGETSACEYGGNGGSGGGGYPSSNWTFVGFFPTTEDVVYTIGTPGAGGAGGAGGSSGGVSNGGGGDGGIGGSGGGGGAIRIDY